VGNHDVIANLDGKQWRPLVVGNELSNNVAVRPEQAGHVRGQIAEPYGWGKERVEAGVGK
jgi:hypothetical protein